MEVKMKTYAIFLCVYLTLLVGCKMPTNNDSNDFKTVLIQPAITTPQVSGSYRSMPETTTEIGQENCTAENRSTTEETESEVVNNTPQIEWDSVVTEINRRLYEIGCATYNDRFFKNRKAYDSPEVECDYYYYQLGLDFTTIRVDRYDDRGANHWYTHYELAHTMENVNKVCEFLGIKPQDLGLQ